MKTMMIMKNVKICLQKSTAKFEQDTSLWAAKQASTKTNLSMPLYRVNTDEASDDRRTQVMTTLLVMIDVASKLL